MKSYYNKIMTNLQLYLSYIINILTFSYENSFVKLDALSKRNWSLTFLQRDALSIKTQLLDNGKSQLNRILKRETGVRRIRSISSYNNVYFEPCCSVCVCVCVCGALHVSCKYMYSLINVY